MCSQRRMPYFYCITTFIYYFITLHHNNAGIGVTGRGFTRRGYISHGSYDSSCYKQTMITLIRCCAKALRLYARGRPTHDNACCNHQPFAALISQSQQYWDGVVCWVCVGPGPFLGDEFQLLSLSSSLRCYVRRLPWASVLDILVRQTWYIPRANGDTMGLRSLRTRAVNITGRHKRHTTMVHVRYT